MKNKRNVGLIFCLPFLSLVSTSCFARENGEKIDETKTTIYVGNIEGGIGEEWLQRAKSKFEDKYKDVEIVDDNGKTKKGVQILITSNKNVAGNNIGTALNTLPYEVYFTELVYYNSLVSNNDLVDLTSMVEQPLTEYGETRSIKDKMFDEYKNFLTVNNKIYAIPHYDSSYALYYDTEMFNFYGFYLKGDGSEKQYALKNGSSYEFTNSEGQLSSGPNGVVGDYDDGLPATYEQFYALCDKMQSKRVTPFSYSGSYSFYLTRFLQTLASNEMGEEAPLFFNFNGSTKNYVESFDANGKPVLKDEVITEETGYKAFHLAGKYYALDFISNLVKNNWINTRSFSTYSHLDAQQDFIKGSYKSNYTQSVDKFGILCEGTWWSNESKNFYNEMAEDKYGNGALESNRKISIMPLPHYSEKDIGKKTTLLCDANLSLSFISASIPQYKLDIAKKFLQFCNTDESLSEFTSLTNSE